MRVAFRTDASVGIGTGHVVRCMTLARGLRERGASVRFICREDAGNLIPRIEREGYSVARLPAAPVPGLTGIGLNPANAHISHGGDSLHTLRHLRTEPVDWLVVDHYGLDHEWERKLRDVAERILVIDDLANRRHECDVLVDSNYFGPATPTRYAALVERGCTQLLGPEYAILQPEYRMLRSLLPPRAGIVTRLLVSFGGSDVENDTLRVLHALSSVNLDHLAVDVVAGQNHPGLSSLQEWVSARKGAALHCGLPSLAGLMARADLAVGGGGSTTWERACLGLPSIVVTQAENQEAFSRALAAEGYQVLLGANRDVSVSDWRVALTDLVGDRDRLALLSQRCGSLTDGLGAERVVATMVKAPSIARPSKSVPQSLLSASTEGGDLARRPEVEPEAAAVTNGLRINVLSDSSSWLNQHFSGLVADLRSRGHAACWSHDPAAIVEGDVCFVVGCSQILEPEVRRKNKFNLVVHESALPEGRGWSPMTWQVLEDRRRVVVTLFEADDRVDAGRIHLQTVIELTGRELVDDWRRHQARATIELCQSWIDGYPDVVRGAREQTGTPSFYRRRRPGDGQLDPLRSIASQFDLLRTVDNHRYPAFFEYRGGSYKLLIECDDPQRVAKLAAERT